MRGVAVASAWVLCVTKSDATHSFVTQVGMWSHSLPYRDGVHNIELGSSRINIGNLV